MPKRFRLPLFLAVTLLAATACSSSEPAAETTLPATTLAATTTAVTTTSVADTTTTTPTTATTTTTVGEVQALFSVSYADGAVEGPAHPQVAVGTLVQLLVTSDVVDEVHLLGYDIKGDVGPDTAALLEFVADTTGSFDLELTDEEVTLLEIEVR